MDKFLPIIIILCVALILRYFLGRIGDKQYNYKGKKYIFSIAEKKFYDALLQVVDARFKVFGKVRMTDVLETKNKNCYGAFNKIKSKHLDFLIVKNDGAIVCAIELDDKSHLRIDRIKRDMFVNVNPSMLWKKLRKLLNLI